MYKSNHIGARLKQLCCVSLLSAMVSFGAVATEAKSQPVLPTLDLSTPEKQAEVIAKIVGSLGTEEKHAFLRFHIYGYTGGNVVPFFSMNNYVVQKWSPAGTKGHYQVKHYEVGYYTEFDTDKPITHWKNPITGEEIELELFILGPISRLYTPQGVISPGLAPQPLQVTVIGDRVFLPMQSIESFPNMFSPEEWPLLSDSPKIYWDSMSTYSASLAEVLDPELKSVRAQIQMQNLTTWQPFLHLGRHPGRSMARAFGQHIAGFHQLSPEVRKGFETYTPEIFDTENWHEVRFDSIDFYNKKMAERKQQAGDN